MSLFGLDTPGAYGPGAGTIRPPVDNSHKGTFPVGSIFYVCQRGDLLGLERIVDKALHVRIPCATCSVKEEVMGLTPLHVASEAGQLEIVEYLLRANVEVGCEDKFLVTPLHLAALEGHTEICAALIAAQAPLAAQDVAGDEPIHWAATKGQDQVIKLLLKAGSHLDAQNHEGWTPLHRAAFTGRPAAVRALIDAGANLSTRTHRGDTPLHLACFSNALTAIEELIKRDNFDRNARNCKGLTPFGMCLTEEAKALMRMYGAEAPTDRVPPPQHNLKLTATATAAKSTDAGAAGADAAAAAAAAAAGGDPGPAQQDGGMLQQHLAHWHATATEEGAPGFSRLAQQATCVPSPPQELERQGQGEGVEGDISSVEGDVDMERVSAELLKITSLRKRELEEFPDPENPGLSRELGEDTRYLSNDFMAEVSSGFSAGANPYNLMRNSSPPLGGHGQESTITGTPITEGPSGTDTPTSSSPASSAFPSKRASLGCDAPFPSNSADPPVPIVAHPPVEPKNGRRERPRGPTKMRPSNSFTAALGRASAPVMDKLGGTGGLVVGGAATMCAGGFSVIAVSTLHAKQLGGAGEVLMGGAATLCGGWTGK